MCTLVSLNRVTSVVSSKCNSIDHHHRASTRKVDLAIGPVAAAAQLFPSLEARQVLGQGGKHSHLLMSDFFA